MSYSTLITGPVRRRRWSEDQKEVLLAETFGPGGNVTETARRAEVHATLLYCWRRATLAPAQGFAPAVLIGEADQSAAPSCPAIFVELPGGVQVQVMADAPPDLVTATLRALR